jgi:hypothetical protein
VPRSLLDAADLRQLRPLTARPGASAIAACLVDAGAVQLDRDDPTWADRDRVFAVDGPPADALRARLHAGGFQADVGTAASGGEALGLAYGAAVVSAAGGGAWRAWCALDEAACDDGTVWEVARAGAAGAAVPLTVVVDGAATAALWRACGWQAVVAPPGDPAHLLAALDRALLSVAPWVVLAGR